MIEIASRAEAAEVPESPVCNLCGGTVFVAATGRLRCVRCKSRIRHRIAYALYQRHGMLDRADLPSSDSGLRVLHFAPERHLHDLLRPAVGSGYICADAVPEGYPWAQCLKLVLPDDLRIFPEAYFDFVVHNHVMEHIPGHFRDHFPGFCRILKPGGKLIFSVPGPNMRALTKEGGEHLASDEERKAQFGQYNHLRAFGRDLPEFLAGLPGGSFAWDDLDDAERARLGCGSKSARFMIWTRDAEAAGRADASIADPCEVSAATRAGIRRPSASRPSTNRPGTTD